MIEHLDGIFERVDFRGKKGIRINYLDTCENFPEHWHSPVEMIRVVQGGYQITGNGKHYLLEEGDIAIIRPGTIHALEAPKNGERVIYLADVEAMCKIADFEMTLTILPDVTVVSGTDEIYKKIQGYLDAVEEEYRLGEPFYETLIYSYIVKVLGILGRYELSRQPENMTETIPSQKHGKILMDVCNYINEHCTEDLTLGQIADLAGFSKYYFTRIFKDFTHDSFYHYLNGKRISYAQQLLVNRDYSVTEVALRSGFSSLPAFIRMFKQWKDCTPTAFRNMYSLDCMNCMKPEKNYKNMSACEKK